MCKNNCNCKKCFPDNICSECQVRTMTDCVTVNPDLPNIGADSGEVLSTVLELIDQQLGETPPIPQVSIRNVGNGREVFKGLSNLGNYEFRTLVPGSESVSITQGTDTITIDFEDSQKTYTASNAGSSGIGVYRDSTISPANTQFNFKNINSANSGTGLALLNSISQAGDTITISGKSIASNSLIITEASGTINIETPVIVDIPRFIVNSASQAPTEDGTLSKPFKTIQGALDAFVGTCPTCTAVAPQFAGAEIVIQKGNGYTFTGNFNYNSLTIILEESTTITSAPSGGINFLCDFDTLPDQSAYLRVILKDNSQIILQKSGFRNSGTTASSFNYALVKTIEITGTGRLVQSSTDISSNIYRIFESNFTSLNTFNNDGAGQLAISGIELSTRTQSLYAIGGNSRFTINDGVLNIDGSAGLNPNSEFLSQIGGTIRINNSMIYIVTSNSVTLNRVFPLSKSASVPSLLIINRSSIEGNMLTLFENMTSLQPRIQITGLTTDFFNCTNIIKSPSVYWTNAVLNNNVFSSGTPDFNQVDLTVGNSQSVYNIFNSKLNESLSRYASRSSAVSAGLKKGDKFINTAGVASPTTGWIIDMVME